VFRAQPEHVVAPRSRLAELSLRNVETGQTAVEHGQGRIIRLRVFLEQFCRLLACGERLDQIPLGLVQEGQVEQQVASGPVGRGTHSLAAAHAVPVEGDSPGVLTAQGSTGADQVEGLDQGGGIQEFMLPVKGECSCGQFLGAGETAGRSPFAGRTPRLSHGSPGPGIRPARHWSRQTARP
jgi:hypothetical protein